MRLQAFLARAGAAPSRRKAEAAISAGRVVVNGAVAELGSKVRRGDFVSLDGLPVSLPDAYSYFALNKPEGYLTTMSDEFGRDAIARLMPKGIPGLVPVGRLDADTTGLILLTNDGDFANLIAHPSSMVEKEYELTVAPPIPDAALKRLAKGPSLNDGPMLPPRLTKPRRTGRNIRFGMTIHEGRNRIIRRACDVVGLKLISLARVRIGGVSLGRLPFGAFRELTEWEIAGIRAAVEKGKVG